MPHYQSFQLLKHINLLQLTTEPNNNTENNKTKEWYKILWAASTKINDYKNSHILLFSKLMSKVVRAGCTKNTVNVF